jgi:lysophospholipase L1-like esterase
MNLKIRILPALLLFCHYILNASAASTPDHWVGTWATAPFSVTNAEYKFGSTDMTFREIVHVTIGGPAVRVILTNEFGLDPLTISEANVAFSYRGSTIDPHSINALSFNGRRSITIPVGALAVSDPVNLKLPPSSDVAVSIFVPAQTIRQLTHHFFASQTSYTAPGNVAAAAALDSSKDITSWFFLKGVDVKAVAKNASIVAFGDSITDGAHKWPDILASRLQTNKKTANLSVLNEGIAGNGIIHDFHGPNALARFDRDVIAQAGVKYVVVLESINDIGFEHLSANFDSPLTAENLISGYSQLAIRAHRHGIKIFGATLTPYVGAFYASPDGEKIREAVNQWIRTTSLLDGVIDFDKVTQDPTNPTVLLPAYDSGDKLHPNGAGSKAMGDSIDFKLFNSK